MTESDISMSIWQKRISAWFFIWQPVSGILRDLFFCKKRTNEGHLALQDLAIILVGWFLQKNDFWKIFTYPLLSSNGRYSGTIHKNTTTLWEFLWKKNRISTNRVELYSVDTRLNNVNNRMSVAQIWFIITTLVIRIPDLVNALRYTACLWKLKLLSHRLLCPVFRPKRSSTKYDHFMRVFKEK